MVLLLFLCLSALSGSFAQNASHSIHPLQASQYGLNLRRVNTSYGPTVEEVHYYTQQYPIGLAVSSDSRIFTCYTRGDYQFTLGVVTNATHEAPFPEAASSPSSNSSSIRNLRPDELNTTYNGIPFGVSSPNLISVQAVIISSATANRPETLWVLDTGRAVVTANRTSKARVTPYAQPGGPKVLAFDLSNGGAKLYKTYTFPADVHYPDSYLNDLRVDLRTNLSHVSDQGVMYLADSSDEGRNGFVILDLGTGHSWRRLTQHPSTLRVQGDVPSYFQKPFYYSPPGQPVSTLREGLDGIQLSADGSRVFYSPLTSRELYSVPSEVLRVPPTERWAELAASANVTSHGRRGGDGNGFEGDSQGRIYMLMPETNAVYYFQDPYFSSGGATASDLEVHGYFSDPRVVWCDSASVGEDGYLYININQLYFQPSWNEGNDLRTFPGVILRVKLPDGAEKVKSA